VLVNAVFREPHNHRQNGAGREPCESLQQPLRDRVGALLHLAGRVDDGRGQRLQEIAAKRAADGSGDGMPNRSERVFLRGS
jgi:hypothetical protein